MARPVFCKCGALIGMDLRIRLGNSPLGSITESECSGKHQQLEITEMPAFFGLVTRVTVIYPETGDVVRFCNYVGPRRRLFLLIACMLVGEEGVRVNGKRCRWTPGRGFYGTGAEEALQFA
jgi:hypothetical protein